MNYYFLSGQGNGDLLIPGKEKEIKHCKIILKISCISDLATIR
jgi:hypothetical protein